LLTFFSELGTALPETPACDLQDGANGSIQPLGPFHGLSSNGPDYSTIHRQMVQAGNFQCNLPDCASTTPCSRSTSPEIGRWPSSAGPGKWARPRPAGSKARPISTGTTATTVVCFCGAPRR